MWESRCFGMRAPMGALCASIIAAPLAGQGLAAATVSVTPPVEPGNPLHIQVETQGALEWVTLFYRVAGGEEFESVMLRRGSGQSFVLDLDAAAFPAGKVDYYLAVKSQAGIGYLPGDAPTSLQSFAMPVGMGGPLPGSQSGSESGAKYTFPFHLEGSIEQVLHHQNETPEERKHTVTGQVQLGFVRETEADRLSVDARVAYTNQPYGNQREAYLAGLQADYSRRNQRVRAGDLVVQESEFTVSGAGRRGADYTYDNQKVYFHSFAVGTQQLAGLDGAAWPHSDTRLYGGALGYKFLEGLWTWKLVYLDGKDDPSEAVNGGNVSFNKVRGGTTVALVQEASLFQNRLNLSGEYARSRVNQDLADSQGSVTDQAWRVGANYNEGCFSGRAGYRSIGKNFDTLGQTGFVGDRVGIDGGVSLSFPDWSLNANVVNERNNPGGSLMDPKAVNQTQTLDERWIFSQVASFRFGLSRGHQESGAQANPQIPFSDSDRLGRFVGLDLVFGPAASLSATYQRDSLESSSGDTGQSATELLSGSFRLGPRCHVSPSLNWTRTESDPGAQVTRIFSAFLSTDTTLVPDALTFALTGGYNRTTLPAGTILRSTTGDAALQFLLNRFLPKGSCVLGLRGRYTRQDTPGQPVLTDNSVALTLNFSI